ncbi:MAG: hypothetical protein J6K43_03750 [Lachnospiraceae bacterium]|nr:hypothetical protein [Lachnospiraceae bacterium]
MGNVEKCAELFEILCNEFHPKKERLGKKVVQKMFYFFERKGIDVNLRYGIHYYGPYSSKLDNMMYMLESEDYIAIDDSGSTHVISLGTERVSEEELSKEEKQIAKTVIDSFQSMSALELEALATMDFISNSLLENSASKEGIIRKFKEIKGDKFNQEVIDHTYNKLVELGYVQA